MNHLGEFEERVKELEAHVAKLVPLLERIIGEVIESDAQKENLRKIGAALYERAQELEAENVSLKNVLCFRVSQLQEQQKRVAELEIAVREARGAELKARVAHDATVAGLAHERP